jgi:hypothetical protein
MILAVRLCVGMFTYSTAHSSLTNAGQAVDEAVVAIAGKSV